MKNSSSKKRKPQNNIESRIMISASKITTRLDLIKNEDNITRQLDREYYEKFISDRKKNTQRTLSAKSKRKDDFAIDKPIKSLKPTRLFQSNEDNYRDQFLKANQKYLSEKTKVLDLSETQMGIKEAVINFAGDFSIKTANKLGQTMGNDRLKEQLIKRVTESKELQRVGQFITQMKKSLQVDELDSLVNILKVKSEKYRNMDQCAFRILQLESINNAQVRDHQQQLEAVRRNCHSEVSRSGEEQQQTINELNTIIQKLQNQLNLELQTRSSILQDIADITSNKQNHTFNQTESLRSHSGFRQINEIKQLLNNAYTSYYHIEAEAEENICKLVQSNQEMLKLERLINQVRDEMTTQIEEQQLKVQDREATINQLQEEVTKAVRQQEMESIANTELRHQLQQEAYQMEDVIKVIAITLSTEPTTAKILIRIKQLSQKNSEQALQVVELEQSISEKDHQITHLAQQCEKMSVSIKELKESSETTTYEKDQYKFLLCNLRQQVSNFKTQHQREIENVIKQKQEEVVRSHQDILESHQKLQNEISELKIENSSLKIESQQHKMEVPFLKNKITHHELDIHQKSNTIDLLTLECQKYKKYLQEIQASFKEVVELEEKSSAQVSQLEGRNNLINEQLFSFKEKNRDLEEENVDLNRKKNEFWMTVSSQEEQLKVLTQEKEKLEEINIQATLSQIDQQTHLNKMQEQLKEMKLENKKLSIGNDRLETEINSATKKLINSRKLLGKNVGGKLREMRNEVLNLRTELILVKSSLMEMQKKCQQQTTKDLFQLKQLASKQTVGDQQTTQTENNLPNQHSSTQTEKALNHQIPLKKLINQLQEMKDLQTQIKSFFKPPNFKEILSQWSQCLNNFNIKEQQKNEAFNKKKEFSEEDDKESQQSKHISQQSKHASQQCKNSNEIYENVNLILDHLKKEESEIPNVSYWQKIQNNYLSLKKKLQRPKVVPSMKLDISGVQPRSLSISSPSASSMCKEFFFEKRVNTDPDEIQEGMKTDRYDCRSNNVLEDKIEELQGHNQLLQEEINAYEQRIESLKKDMQELDGKNTQLENVTSVKTLQNSFKKLLDNILRQYFYDNFREQQLFEQTCRIMMKLLQFNASDMKVYEEQINKKKKKKGGFLSSLFK